MGTRSGGIAWGTLDSSLSSRDLLWGPLWQYSRRRGTQVQGHGLQHCTLGNMMHVNVIVLQRKACAWPTTPLKRRAWLQSHIYRHMTKHHILRTVQGCSQAIRWVGSILCVQKVDPLWNHLTISHITVPDFRMCTLADWIANLLAVWTVSGSSRLNS